MMKSCRFRGTRQRKGTWLRGIYVLQIRLVMIYWSHLREKNNLKVCFAELIGKLHAQLLIALSEI